MRPSLIRIGCWMLAGLALQAHALQIVSVTPQGEVARVRQVMAKLDDSAVNFGDPKSPAPVSLSCTEAQRGRLRIGAVVQLFHLGLQGTTRVVDEFLV